MSFKHNQPLLIWFAFFTAILAILFREPNFFIEPRIWAEEGTRYYSVAYYFSQSPLWYQGITNVQRGYFALWPNLSATIAANTVPVEQASLFMTISAFLVQLIPLYLIIWGKAELWNSLIKKILGISIYILTPLSGEIWLNTINSQFFLALTVIFLLFEPTQQHPLKKWIYRLLLTIAGLTGLVSSMIAPVYLIIVWLTKDRERLIQSLILVGCAILQIILLIYSSSSDRTVSLRFSDGRIYLLIFSIWTQNIGLLFGGLENMQFLSNWIIAEHSQGGTTIIAIWIGMLTILIGLLWYLAINLSLTERIIFIGSYVLILLFSYIGALGANKINLIIPGMGERYFWIPNIILSLLFMINIFRSSNNKIKQSTYVLCLLIILILGGMSYKKTILSNEDWPKWHHEIAEWRQNPENKIQIWPAGWEIMLKRKE